MIRYCAVRRLKAIWAQNIGEREKMETTETLDTYERLGLSESYRLDLGLRLLESFESEDSIPGFFLEEEVPSYVILLAGE